MIIYYFCTPGYLFSAERWLEDRFIHTKGSPSKSYTTLLAKGRQVSECPENKFKGHLMEVPKDMEEVW